MPKHGEMPANQVMFSERWVQTQANYNLPGNAETILNIGSFTMPCPGWASAHGVFKVTWDPGNNQYVEAGFAPTSSPAPFDSGAGIVCDSIPGTSFISARDIPAWGRWKNLSQGQTVTMHGRVYVGGGAITTIWQWSLVLVRVYHQLFSA